MTAILCMATDNAGNLGQRYMHALKTNYRVRVRLHHSQVVDQTEPNVFTTFSEHR